MTPRCSPAPVVSFVSESNAVTSAGWSLTLSGLGFGSFDATPSWRLGSTSCVTAAWASSTSTVCLLAPGEGEAKDAVATVAAVAGTRIRSFSYDGAVTSPDLERGLANGLCSVLDF